MLHGISQFVRLPLFGPIGAVLSVLLLAALVLAIVGSLWIVRIPGRVSVLEVGRHKRLSGVVVACMFLGVLCCVAGALYLHFPVSSPKVVVLSSRVRSLATTTEAGRDAWSQRWEALLDESEHACLIDAGELVDRVCQALGRQPPAVGWIHDDPTVLEHIREIARAVIFEHANDAPTHTRDELRTKLGAPSGLPLWVIESVEIGVLKSLALSHNTRAIRVLAQPRVTSIGRTWDESVEAYLIADATRYEPLEITIDGETQHPPVLLTSFYRALQTDKGVRAVLLFDIDSERLPHTPEQLKQDLIRLQLYADPERPEESVLLSAKAELDLSTSGTQFASMLFEGVALGDVAGVRQVGSGMYLPAPLVPGARSSALGTANGASAPAIALRVDRNDVAGWAHSILALRSDRFATWRRDMINGRLTDGREPADLLHVDSGPGVASVSVLVTDRGLWIGPSDSLTTPPRFPQPVETSGNTGRGRSLPPGAPGVYSWDGVQLSNADRFTLGPQTEEVVPLALGRTLTKSVRNGDQSHRSGPDPVLVVEMLDASDVAGRGLRTAVTYLGLDPLSAGVVFQRDGLPPENYDEARFLSFWTEILRAAHASSSGASSSADGRVRDESTSAPFVLLDTASQNKLRARSVAVALRVFVIGLLLFAVTTVVSSILASSHDRT